MRKMSLMIATLFFLMIAGGSRASAQVTDTIKADIPFDFTVGKVNMPAGSYTIKSLDSMPEGVMEIRGAGGRRARVFLTESAQAARDPRKTELIFDRAGDQYFLSEIFEEGSRFGIEVPKSRVEKRLEKEGVIIQSHYVAIPAEEEVGSRN